MKYVFIDPDGTMTPYLAVIIRHPTGVTYRHQCDGVTTDERELEGYLIPLSGGPDRAATTTRQALTDVFHADRGCLGGPPLEAHRPRLSDIVRAIPFWHGDDQCTYLQLDLDRITEACEAWLPVITADGDGILIWPNCD